MCLRPLHIDLIEVGCGQCMNCRFNKQREWIVRMTLEQGLWSSSCFPTLTYSDGNLPERGTLVKKHLQDFLKRERHNGPLAYYATGEYGERKWRPHYHLALFGRDFAELPRDKDGLIDLPTWEFGKVHVGRLEPHSMRYVCSYLTKRMTRANDKRLERTDPATGEIYRLAPEFSTMSLRPSIGAKAIRAYGKFLGTSAGKLWITEHGDVPRELRIGAKRLPIGRYLTNALRDYAWLMPSLRDTLRQDRIKALSKLRAASEGVDEVLQRDRAARREISRLRGERLSRKQKRGDF